MRAWPTDLSPDVGVDAAHATDQLRVDALVRHIIIMGHWRLPPVLVVESCGNGVTVLDGHHRLAAARKLASMGLDWDLGRISAWEVSREDFEAWVEEHGDPARLCDLDSEIALESGLTYEATGWRADGR